MKKRSNLSSFLAGILVTVFVVTLIVPVMAATTTKKNIDVYTGIKVYINDQLLIPDDGNGNPVDPFVYNGTTYLPIRAIANALGVAVNYDASTNSAYLGSHESNTPAVMLANMDYFYTDGRLSFLTVASDRDNLGNTHTNCIISGIDRKYHTNGQYTRMTGTLYQRYKNRNNSVGEGTAFEVYGDGKLLYSRRFDESVAGYQPEKFDIDISGVLELSISLEYPYYTYGQDERGIAVGDCGLYT